MLRAVNELNVAMLCQHKLIYGTTDQVDFASEVVSKAPSNNICANDVGVYMVRTLRDNIWFAMCRQLVTMPPYAGVINSCGRPNVQSAVKADVVQSVNTI